MPLNFIFWGFILTLGLPIKFSSGLLEGLELILITIGQIMIIYGCYKLLKENKYFKGATISSVIILVSNFISFILLLYVQSIDFYNLMGYSILKVILIIFLAILLNGVYIYFIYSLLKSVSVLCEEKDSAFLRDEFKKLWKNFKMAIITIGISIVLIFTPYICDVVKYNFFNDKQVYLYESNFLSIIGSMFLLIGSIIIIVNRIQIIIAFGKAHNKIELREHNIEKNI